MPVHKKCLLQNELCPTSRWFDLGGMVEVVKQYSRCSIMLTGGRTAESLYQRWSKHPEFSSAFEGARFFFGDERCVPPSHVDSNYKMARDSLFSRGLPHNVEIYRMEAECTDLNSAANRYAKLLPNSLDVLILTVGEDGHIASIFPHSPTLRESLRKIVPAYAPRNPHARLTITPPVIQNAKHVFVLALGEQKRLIYQRALLSPADIDELPVRLVLNRTWIFDTRMSNLPLTKSR